MLKQIRNGLLAAAAGAMLLSAPAMACGDPANMTHVGMVAKVEGQTLILVDAQTGKSLTFVITAEQAARVSANDRVVIHYAEDGGNLIAQEISA